MMHEAIQKGGGKRIEVVEYRTFQPLSSDIDMSVVEAYVRSLDVNFERNLRIIEKSGIKRIHLTNHARQRWDTRVGPADISDENLIELLTNMCVHLGRIELLTKDCGLIDNDIVFIYEQEKDLMKIITFYGRVSQRPALADVKHLKLLLYSLDAYDNCSDVFFHLTESSPKKTGKSVFRLQNEGVQISKSTVKALRMMKYLV